MQGGLLKPGEAPKYRCVRLALFKSLGGTWPLRRASAWRP